MKGVWKHVDGGDLFDGIPMVAAVLQISEEGHWIAGDVDDAGGIEG